MTRTASQKARARARRAQQSAQQKVVVQPIPVVPLPQRQPRNRGRGNNDPTRVNSGGNRILDVPSRRINVQKTYFKVMGERMHNGHPCLEIQARDFLTSLSFQTTNTVGQAIFNSSLQPTSGLFNRTRLQRMCSMYEKYVFTNLEFEVDSGAGSAVNGNYIIAYDKDPSDPTPVGTDEAIREYSAWEGTQMFQLGVSGRVSFPLTDPQDFYYSSPAAAGISDERLVAQGQIYIAIGTQVPSVNIGAGLYCRYTIHLFDPELMALTADSYMTSNGYQPSNSNGQAWPVAAFPIGNIQQVGEKIQKILDSSGQYRGFFLNPGKYILEQTFGNNTAAQTIAACLLTAADPSKQAECVVRNIQNIVSVAGGTAFRFDELTIPFGGANCFGTVSVNTTTTGASVRIIDPNLAQIL